MCDWMARSSFCFHISFSEGRKSRQFELGFPIFVFDELVLGTLVWREKGSGGANHVLFPRSPSTPELSADELPDDIANEITDIPHDLELNQEDFSDVLPRLPDDLQDFDFFEGVVNILIQDFFFF